MDWENLGIFWLDANAGGGASEEEGEEPEEDLEEDPEEPEDAETSQAKPALSDGTTKLLTKLGFKSEEVKEWPEAAQKAVEQFGQLRGAALKDLLDLQKEHRKVQARAAVPLKSLEESGLLDAKGQPDKTKVDSLFAQAKAGETLQKRLDSLKKHGVLDGQMADFLTDPELSDFDAGIMLSKLVKGKGDEDDDPQSQLIKGFLKDGKLSKSGIAAGGKPSSRSKPAGSSKLGGGRSLPGSVPDFIAEARKGAAASQRK